MKPEPNDVTRLLHAWNNGDAGAQEELWSILYGELKVLARSSLNKQGGREHHQTTSLVNQAYMRLLGSGVDWNDRKHFFAVAARAMRFLLVEEARRRMAQKRGGEDRAKAPGLDEQADVADASASNPEEVVAVHEALHKLGELNPRYAELVELRYFAGLSVEEAAEILDVTTRTVVRDWKTVRLWLARELGADTPHG